MILQALNNRMNQDLSILALVLHASWVVQLVMLLLLVVSVASWAAIFRKLFAPEARASRSTTTSSATSGPAPA